MQPTDATSARMPAKTKAEGALRMVRGYAVTEPGAKFGEVE